MDRNLLAFPCFAVLPPSLSARRAWIEIVQPIQQPRGGMSLSARRAWIEIIMPCVIMPALPVALRKESVDRNARRAHTGKPQSASLSARRAWIEIPAQESSGAAGASLSARRAWIEMPRPARPRPPYRVALRKESVDRNLLAFPCFAVLPPSLSARRAWIEITCTTSARYGPTVALRKESVDRNVAAGVLWEIQGTSLSARRAWIEISDTPKAQENPIVALRKESVDRNCQLRALPAGIAGRSPQGERG